MAQREDADDSLFPVLEVKHLFQTHTQPSIVVMAEHNCFGRAGCAACVDEGTAFARFLRVNSVFDVVLLFRALESELKHNYFCPKDSHSPHSNTFPFNSE